MFYLDAAKKHSPEVAFVLHCNRPPFQEIRRFTVNRDHFEAAILVADTRSEEGDGGLFLVMFTPLHMI